MLEQTKADLHSAIEKKVADTLLKRLYRYGTQHWKTTVCGLIAGSIPIVNSIIDAWNKGAFEGQNAQQVAVGIVLIAWGVVSADAKTTTTTTP